MHVIYTGESFPNSVKKSMFLVGPTPRTLDVPSWRIPGALDILRKLNYRGHIFVPEFRDNKFREISDDYKREVIIPWETEGLNRADIIVAWVPRDLDNMPAFTTNFEVGEWYDSGKFVLGAPKFSPKNDYLFTKAAGAGVLCFNSLDRMLDHAVNYLGGGALRNKGETKVPIIVWDTASFQFWYGKLVHAGNCLDDARVLWTMRKQNGPVMAWALWVKVWLDWTHEYKEEVIFGRAISETAYYYCELDNK